ncbi:MAG: hypothetical protein FWC26_00445, partial [Fibromonadales bacterium]|nr:hypothetical protein [Fibromonadales bacterium]
MTTDLCVVIWLRQKPKQHPFCMGKENYALPLTKQNPLAISAFRRNSTHLACGEIARFLATPKTQATPVLHGQGESCFAHAKYDSLAISAFRRNSA